MPNSSATDVEPFPEMALQINPTQEHGGLGTGESQEIIVDSAGKAILVGESDVESDRGGRPLASRAHAKGGICPVWLSSSSPRTKGLLGLVTTLLLCFVLVMIIGVVQSSAPAVESMASDQNKVTDPDEAPSPAPTEPSPSSTDSVLMYEINILLSDFLEAKVPNFTDGLTSAEMQNLNLINDHIESAISESLSDRLPQGYSVESVQVDKFDGYSTTDGKRERTRHLQERFDIIHNVLYSASVTADCQVADCSAAVDIVAGVTSDLSQLEFLQVSAEAESPTKSPVASTLAPVISTTAPTKYDSTPPTVSPISTTSSPIPLILSDRENVCTGEEPCGKCLGPCIVDDACEEGLLCFQRFGYEIVPGCSGPGIPSQTYCYDPFANGLNETDLLGFGEKACDRRDPCEKCRGECFGDEYCGKDLFCYRRFGFESVPGCAGQGTFGVDYCFDPAILAGSS